MCEILESGSFLQELFMRMSFLLHLVAIEWSDVIPSRCLYALLSIVYIID
jgi:hypothetical protein